MSINLEESIESLILALAQTIEDVEPYLEPFVLEQGTEPQQTDWEAAWVLAGNSLPIPEDQELYWKAGEVIRGQFGRTNDRFYAIFPSNSVSLAGVVHFAYTKFLGWENEQHFLFSGTQLNDAGQYVGLLRAYLDGTLEQVDFTGFSPTTLLGYDESQGKLWYIEGTDLKRIDTTTEAITVIANGITVEPTSIAFDGAGDAFCTINIGAGLDVYRWNNTGATFTSFKASITVNGVGEDPGQVICASLNYVVVLTSVSNYWVQIARAGGAETQIKSNPAGATSDNLPQPNATAWVQTFTGRTLDILSIVFTELTGTPSIGEWRRTLLWNMATATYTEIEILPYDDFIAMCIAEAPNLDPLNYEARRDINYHTLTSAYRKRVASAWEYHNISGIRANILGSRQILETDDGQIFVWSNGSSGKIWRLSNWDQEGVDAVVLGVISLQGLIGETIGGSDYIRYGGVDISLRPEGFDLIEVSFNSGLSNDLAALRSGYLYSEILGTGTRINNLASGGVYIDNNTYVNGGNSFEAAANGTDDGSFVKALLFIEKGALPTHLLIIQDTTNTGIVNQTVTTQIVAGFSSIATFSDFEGLSALTILSGGAGPNISHLGGYFMIRALRTEARRQGGAYYDPSMA